MSRPVSRVGAQTLMRRVGIRPSTIAGPSRKRHSLRKLQTMDTLSDPVQYFVKALKTELEHGTANASTNITNDDLAATAKIVAAHLFGVERGERPTKWKWFPGYYDYLWEMEKKGPR